MNKIITLGDIFRNLETEEKAFKFLGYIKDMQKEIDRLGKLFYERNEENIRLNNIINEFEDFITDVDSHINLGDESEEFILVRDKWLELQELKGVDKE